MKTNKGIYYLRRDHQGSVTALVDKNGDIIEEYSYDAWERRRTADTWEYYTEPQTTLFHRGYTFHEHMDEFDLINMNGRAYDPIVGRFLSADIIVQNPERTQGYNRYSYCLNNPLKYNDPSGYFLIGGGLKDYWQSIKAWATWFSNTPLDFWSRVNKMKVERTNADAQDNAGANSVSAVTSGGSGGGGGGGEEPPDNDPTKAQKKDADATYKTPVVLPIGQYKRDQNLTYFGGKDAFDFYNEISPTEIKTAAGEVFTIATFAYDIATKDFQALTIDALEAISGNVALVAKVFLFVASREYTRQEVVIGWACEWNQNVARYYQSTNENEANYFLNANIKLLKADREYSKWFNFKDN